MLRPRQRRQPPILAVLILKAVLPQRWKMYGTLARKWVVAKASVRNVDALEPMVSVQESLRLALPSPAKSTVVFRSLRLALKNEVLVELAEEDGSALNTSQSRITSAVLSYLRLL